MNALVRVTVAPDRLALAPGESADVVVTIQNAGPVVEHFTTTVVGLPRDDLFTVEPATVKLRPKETGTTQVRITVPPRGLLVAGPYVLGILVRSPYQRDASYCAELPLAVAPVPVLAMAVQPEVVLGGDRGAYTVALSNEGNTTLAVALTGSDPERRVGFEFDPERVLLEPGTGSGVAVRVRANAPFTGQEVRRALTLRAHAGELESERPATFVQRPRLAGGLVRVAGIAAGIAALAGAAVGGALLIRDNKTEQVAQLLPTPPAIPTALPQPSSPPSLPSSLPPSSVPSPSSLPPSPSSSTPSSASQPPGESTITDFSRLPDNQPAGDRLIQPTLYKGLTLSSDAERSPTDCRDATSVALRTTGTFGGFLTSARPAGANLCNNLPVRIELAQPARQLTLTVIGTGGDYTLRLQLADGTVESRTVTPPPNTPAQIPYEAPAGNTIKSLTYGHANPDPTTKAFTIIKSLATIPA